MLYLSLLKHFIAGLFVRVLFASLLVLAGPDWSEPEKGLSEAQSTQASCSLHNPNKSENRKRIKSETTEKYTQHT
jgi:hypothetical protein